MKEIWKDIKGYEGLYQVSNLGRVKSLKRKSRPYEKILVPLVTNKDYLCVNLYKNNKNKKFLIHRLVAKEFLKNEKLLPQVNHKDENTHNNNVNNLEWCDSSYNNNYGTKIERLSKNSPFAKKVCQYTVDNVFIKEWENSRFAVIGNNYFNRDKSKFKTLQTGIIHCCLKSGKTAYGFKWKYN